MSISNFITDTPMLNMPNKYQNNILKCSTFSLFPFNMLIDHSRYYIPSHNELQGGNNFKCFMLKQRTSLAEYLSPEFLLVTPFFFIISL